MEHPVYTHTRIYVTHMYTWQHMNTYEHTWRSKTKKKNLNENYNNKISRTDQITLYINNFFLFCFPFTLPLTLCRIPLSCCWVWVYIHFIFMCTKINPPLYSLILYRFTTIARRDNVDCETKINTITNIFEFDKESPRFFILQ